MQDVKKIIPWVACGFILLLLVACSTRKNTASTRFYHGLTTRYNVYFNGKEAYKLGCKAVEEGNKDNYLELLPLYPVGNETTVGTGSGEFERAISKAEKAIREHSIKRRPVRKPGRTYTAEYKQWLARREFNPFLHHAWMLMGKAQFQKGDFPEAASTFSYIARLYAGQPNITADARIWLARCYAQLGWLYDAEDVLGKVNNDSLPYNLIPSYATVYGHFLLGSKRYKEAIPQLLITIKNEPSKRQRARQYYLLGQIYQLLNQPTEAYQAYSKVIRLTPPYELELSARIRQTEVIASSSAGTSQSSINIEKTVSRLRKMTRSDKNKEYLDQIYYALGNIYLARRDTAQAISEYSLGVEKSTRSGVEKGMLQLTLGNLYWLQGKYAEAQLAYAAAIGMIDKAHPQYEEVTKRSAVLDELVPYATAVQLQDSLQHLASLDSVARMQVIERIIAELIKKEEEAKKQEELDKLMAQREQVLSEGETNRPPAVTQPQGPVMDKSWYFYNPQLVTQGKAEFQRQWGRRKAEDNWRRKNKTVVSLSDPIEEVGDSIAATGDTNAQLGETPIAEGGATAIDTLADEKNPLFYLDQIPLTPEKMEESNSILSESLYYLALIYKDKLEDLILAERTLNRLIRQFPDFKEIDFAYYHLYLLYLAKEHRATDSPQVAAAALASAESTKQELIHRFPKSKYAIALSNPDFVYDAIYGRHLEDSLYANTYEAYQAGNYQQVIANAERSATKYPLGIHRPKFLFFNAAVALQQGAQKQFLAELKSLVQQYPANEITSIAAHILKGVQEGRLLADGARSFGRSPWSLRSSADAVEDSLGIAGSALTDSIASFNPESNVPFLFLLAYEEGKVNEDLLLYELARYNFTAFLVKNFDLSFAHDRGIGQLLVRSFANYGEVLQYFRRLYADPHMNERLSGMRAVLISEANYNLLMNSYSFDDYDAFYRKNFPYEEMLKSAGNVLLDEPLLNLPTEEEELEREKSEEAQEPEEGGVIYLP